MGDQLKMTQYEAIS